MTDHTVQMGSEEGNEDRQSAQVGHRLTVVLEIPVRPVDDAKIQRSPARHRHPHQRQKVGQKNPRIKRISMAVLT